MKVKSLSRARLLATLWTGAYQAPPSMKFSRQEYWSGVPLPSPGVYIEYIEYWSGLPFPSLGDLPEPRIEPETPVSPLLIGEFFTTESPGKPKKG